MRSEETINKNFGNLNDKMTFKILSICKKKKNQTIQIIFQGSIESKRSNKRKQGRW